MLMHCPGPAPAQVHAALRRMAAHPRWFTGQLRAVITKETPHGDVETLRGLGATLLPSQPEASLCAATVDALACAAHQRVVVFTTPPAAMEPLDKALQFTPRGGVVLPPVHPTLHDPQFSSKDAHTPLIAETSPSGDTTWSVEAVEKLLHDALVALEPGERVPQPVRGDRALLAALGSNLGNAMQDMGCDSPGAVLLAVLQHGRGRVRRAASCGDDSGSDSSVDSAVTAQSFMLLPSGGSGGAEEEGAVSPMMSAMLTLRGAPMKYRLPRGQLAFAHSGGVGVRYFMRAAACCLALGGEQGMSLSHLRSAASSVGVHGKLPVAIAGMTHAQAGIMRECMAEVPQQSVNALVSCVVCCVGTLMPAPAGSVDARKHWKRDFRGTRALLRCSGPAQAATLLRDKLASAIHVARGGCAASSDGSDEDAAEEPGSNVSDDALECADAMVNTGCCPRDSVAAATTAPPPGEQAFSDYVKRVSGNTRHGNSSGYMSSKLSLLRAPESRQAAMDSDNWRASPSSTTSHSSA